MNRASQQIKNGRPSGTSNLSFFRHEAQGKYTSNVGSMGSDRDEDTRPRKMTNMKKPTSSRRVYDEEEDNDSQDQDAMEVESPVEKKRSIEEEDKYSDYLSWLRMRDDKETEERRQTPRKKAPTEESEAETMASPSKAPSTHVTQRQIECDMKEVAKGVRAVEF